MALAETLVASGFLPQAIQKPAQALAIILAGQELGLPPMRALREIHVINGKPVLSAELMLSLFKRRGGRSQWRQSDARIAELWLKHPNGDEHIETFAFGDAVAAGIAGKDNWKKYPKAMLRARAISAGLRALGEADGVYDPDEMGAVTTETGEVYEPPASAVAGGGVANDAVIAAMGGTEAVAAMDVDVASRSTRAQHETIRRHWSWLGWSDLDISRWLLDVWSVETIEALPRATAAEAIVALGVEVERLMPVNPASTAQVRKFHAAAKSRFPGPGGRGSDETALRDWLAQNFDGRRTTKFFDVPTMAKAIDMLENGDAAKGSGSEGIPF
jgi:hypothetical protein